MQEKNGRRSNLERSAATRAQLLRAARRLFVEKGYAETGTPEIVEAAGVTRGALYHHFADKRALFAALVAEEAKAVSATIEAKAAASEPVEGLLRGSRAYLEAMAAPGRCRLLLIDGPAVLGRDEIVEIDAANAAGSLRTGLEAAITAGAIAPLPLDALASQLSALFDRAALEIDRGGLIEDHVAVIEAIIHGFRHAG